MPFSDDHLPLYEEAIKAAIEVSGFVAIRTDRLNLVGNVVEVLRTAISGSSCALAVITGNNPNVMYELGLAHAQGKPVVLLCERKRGETKFSDLPYDIRNEFVIGYADDLAAVRQAIVAVLTQLKGG